MAYAKYASITVDNTKVSGSADLSNFQVLVSGTYDGTGGEPDLRTSGNGGQIQNTDASGGASGSYTVPADLAFYDDTDQTTQYEHEVIEYAAASGLFRAYVKIPTLEYDADTVFYMFYGDSGVTTSQEDISNTWGSDFDGVWHMTTTGTQYDSSSNGYDLTEGGTPGSGTGHITTNCPDFNKSNPDYYYINISTATAINSGDADYTWSTWFKSDLSSNQGILTMGWDTNTKVDTTVILTDGDLSETCNDLSPNTRITSGGVGANEWWYVYFSYDQSANTRYIRAYKASDGTEVSVTNSSQSGSRFTQSTSGNGGGSTPFVIGLRYFGGAFSNLPFDGNIQGARVSNVYRTSDWHLTEFNTQNSPSTFYTMGSETDVPVAGGGDTPRGCLTTMTKFWGI